MEPMQAFDKTFKYGALVGTAFLTLLPGQHTVSCGYRSEPIDE